MLHFDGTNLVYIFEWWHLIVLNAIYGFVTHLHSLKEWEPDCVVWAIVIMFGRMSIQLPVRITCLLIGLPLGLLCLVGAGSFCGDVLEVGWRWHLPPEQLDWDQQIMFHLTDGQLQSADYVQLSGGRCVVGPLGGRHHHHGTEVPQFSQKELL